ncbi:hypothetical protein [Geodermatophilus normandii]|uniref:hypothetical protein n=1 Tax=Geodermatophilus normandii TaxID=1137989 RepID=UPI001EF83D65|nr:hypothetical protein [Geodermatophilus normandii]
MTSRSRPAAAANASTCSWARKTCSSRAARGSGTPVVGSRASRPSRTAKVSTSDNPRWAWRTVAALSPERYRWATQLDTPW